MQIDSISTWSSYTETPCIDIADIPFTCASSLTSDVWEGEGRVTYSAAIVSKHASFSADLGIVQLQGALS